MSSRCYAKILIPTVMIDTEVAEEIKEYRFEETEEEDGVSSFAGDAHYGTFEELETMLVGKKIPYTRETESAFGDPAKVTHYRQESGIVEISLTSDGEPYVEAEKLRPLLDLSPDNAMAQLKVLLGEHSPPVKSIYEYVVE